MPVSLAETMVFTQGVLSIMRSEKVGVEPALARFRDLAIPLGDFPGLREEFEIAADKFRGTIEKARELVALADQPPADDRKPVCKCAICTA